MYKLLRQSEHRGKKNFLTQRSSEGSEFIKGRSRHNEVTAVQWASLLTDQREQMLFMG